MTRLVLRGGHVIDPAASVDGAYDVVIDDDRITELAPAGTGVPGAEEVIDVTDALVTPGLVDLHGHWWEGSPYGLDPRTNLRGGVTFAVDAGTAGFSNFDAFRRLTLDSAPVRMRAFLHVAAAGLVSPLVGELEDIRYARPRETAAVIDANRDVLVGVKVRIGTGAAGANCASALAAALEAAELARAPLMVHIADGADIGAIFTSLRPGDIVTHALTALGPRIVDEGGRVRQEVWDAHERGVRLDVGHGCGSFSWATARAALADGLAPDTISTDLHRYSVERPVVDLPLTMSKLLHLGMSLPDVVRATTVTAATLAGAPELGTLRAGAPADVAVLRLVDQPMALSDSTGVVETVERVLRADLTIIGGVVTRAGEVDVPLRPYLEADHEVDCLVPI
jgi:dihydroorotase